MVTAKNGIIECSLISQESVQYSIINVLSVKGNMTQRKCINQNSVNIYSLCVAKIHVDFLQSTQWYFLLLLSDSKSTDQCYLT